MKPLSQTLLEKLVPTLFEDDHILAVGKAAGVDAGGAAEQRTPGLVEILADLRGKGETLRPVNRLGRDESGVLLLGKDAATAERIRTDLKSSRVVQEYLGIVRGRMREARVKIGERHGASRGRRGKPQRPASSKASTAMVGAPTKVVRLQEGKTGTLVRCHTGVKTTHALRAQLRSAGLRLRGDTVGDRPSEAKRRGGVYLRLTRLSFKHPANRSKVNIVWKMPQSAMAELDGRADPVQSAQSALVRRLPCMAEPDTDSFRLLTGQVEGVRGLVVEKYGEVVVFQLSDETPELQRALPGVAKWYLDTFPIRAVYTKRFARDRVTAGVAGEDEHHSPKPFVGRPVAEQIVVREHGLRFAIRPYDGVSVGLFLDHRDNRGRIRAMSARKQVLNLFAYTCGFSVAAAKGGADAAVSVDLSRKHLDWGRKNFELNQIDPDAHEFFCSDAFSFLRGAARKSRSFDIIIIDPPSFAHGRKRKQDFSVTRNLSDLITASLTVLGRGGTLMISTNYRQLSMTGLRDRVSAGAGRRKFKIIETPRLPLDFACDPQHARTMLVRFD